MCENGNKFLPNIKVNIIIKGFIIVLIENPLCTNGKSKAYTGKTVCHTEVKISGKFGKTRITISPSKLKTSFLLFASIKNNSLKKITPI